MLRMIITLALDQVLIKGIEDAIAKLGVSVLFESFLFTRDVSHPRGDHGRSRRCLAQCFGDGYNIKILDALSNVYSKRVEALKA